MPLRRQPEEERLAGEETQAWGPVGAAGKMEIGAGREGEEEGESDRCKKKKREKRHVER